MDGKMLDLWNEIGLSVKKKVVFKKWKTEKNLGILKKLLKNEADHFKSW